ncbi:hypothetical protein [Actinomadura chibensis]|uniref:Mce-associated membrane protein n=1 Tax=Actinomadura chibensis TaxID=392828 RepID=A0A5D0NL86_9ACTN|nr:hypothetical protein [Actinomadura chibensis]TYB45237.1 hypothetical protein FXF69_17405 [Actinomadura chibensis]
MTAKTTKDEAVQDEAVPVEADAAEADAVEADAATEAAEASAEEAAAVVRKARPAAKRKRRVRVIEVIDDEDLDDVLEALDAEDEAEEAEEEVAPRPAKPKPKPKPKPVAKAKPPKPRPPVEAVEAEDEEPPAGPRAAGQTVFGMGAPQAVVVVVLVALLASLALWQWRSASSQSSKQDEREAVSKVVSAYGDIVYNYNAGNYQAQSAKVQKFLAGDLLEEYKKNVVPSVASAFQANPQMLLTTKTDQVFVGGVDGRFATAVLMLDLTLKNKSSTVDEPATLLRLSLGKIDGQWKITQQYPSGVNDQNRNRQQGGLPSVPGGAGTSPSPKAEKSGKPKD